MRYVSMFVVVLLVFAFALTFAAIAAAGQLTPRPVDPVAAETLARGAEKSATIRSLIAVIERSNVIVHIESSRALPLGVSGWTRFVTSRGGYRYVRITLDAALPLRWRSIILAHELQHACEVAQSAAADGKSLRALFERTGHRAGNYYDTRAALEVERHARLEIDTPAHEGELASPKSARRRALQAEPVAQFDH